MSSHSPFHRRAAMTLETLPDKTKPALPATDWPTLEEVLALDAIRTVLLHGPPGIGKTYAAIHFGRVDAGVESITLTEDTPAAELRGHFLPTERGFVWHDGPFTAAMRKGCRLIVNEISHGAEEALTLLHPVLESIETARLTLPNNETIVPAPGFHVVATDNAPPEALPHALQDRFQCRFELDEPHPAALARLEEPFRTAAARSFALDEDRRISLRGWSTLQALEPHLGLERACAAVLGRERGALVHDVLVLAAASTDVGEAS